MRACSGATYFAGSTSFRLKFLALRERREDIPPAGQANYRSLGNITFRYLPQRVPEHSCEISQTLRKFAT
jgi:hypothetical protein